MSVRCERCGPNGRKECDHACSCPPDCVDGLPCDIHGWLGLRDAAWKLAPFAAITNGSERTGDAYVMLDGTQRRDACLELVQGMIQSMLAVEDYGDGRVSAAQVRRRLLELESLLGVKVVFPPFRTSAELLPKETK